MAKIKYIPVDIYRIKPIVFVGNLKEFKSFAEQMCKKDKSFKFVVDDINDNLQQLVYFEAATYWNTKIRKLIIYVPSLSLTPNNIDNVVHELSHATFQILDDVGIKVDADNNEAYAYLIGYLASEVYTKDGYEELQND